MPLEGDRFAMPYSNHFRVGESLRHTNVDIHNTLCSPEEVSAYPANYYELISTVTTFLCAQICPEKGLVDVEPFLS